MDFSCIDIRELLDSTLSKWFENPGDKSPNLDDLGIQLDCNDTTKDTSKDTKERFVEPSVIPQVYVNEYNEDIDPTWTNMENAKWASKKEADLVGETDQDTEVYYDNYRSRQLEPKEDFVEDITYPAGIETRLYTQCAEEGAQPINVVDKVEENVVDNVSNNITDPVSGQSGTPRNYGNKKPGATSFKNYASSKSKLNKVSIEIPTRFYHGSQRDNIKLLNGPLYLTQDYDDARDFAEGYLFDYDLQPEDIPVVYTIDISVSNPKIISTEEEYDELMDLTVINESMEGLKNDGYDSIYYPLIGNIVVFDAASQCNIINKEVIGKESSFELTTIEKIAEEIIVEADLESKKPYLLQQLNKADITGDEAEKVIKQINEADPTGNYATYTQWLLGQYLKGNFKLEDTNEARELLKTFNEETKSKRLKGVNINQSKYQDLKTILEEHLGTSDKASDKLSKELENTDAEFLTSYTDKETGDKYDLIKVTNPEDAEKLFSGSDWCVRHPETAEHYLEDGNFLLLRKNGENYLLKHPNDFKYVNDTDPSDEMIEEFNTVFNNIGDNVDVSTKFELNIPLTDKDVNSLLDNLQSMLRVVDNGYGQQLIRRYLQHYKQDMKEKYYDAVCFNIFQHNLDDARELMLDGLINKTDTPTTFNKLVEHLISYGNSYLVLENNIVTKEDGELFNKAVTQSIENGFSSSLLIDKIITKEDGELFNKIVNKVIENGRGYELLGSKVITKDDGDLFYKLVNSSLEGKGYGLGYYLLHYGVLTKEDGELFEKAVEKALGSDNEYQLLNERILTKEDGELFEKAVEKAETSGNWFKLLKNKVITRDDGEVFNHLITKIIENNHGMDLVQNKILTKEDGELFEKAVMQSDAKLLYNKFITREDGDIFYKLVDSSLEKGEATSILHFNIINKDDGDLYNKVLNKALEDGKGYYLLDFGYITKDDGELFDRAVNQAINEYGYRVVENGIITEDELKNYVDENKQEESTTETNNMDNSGKDDTNKESAFEFTDINKLADFVQEFNRQDELTDDQKNKFVNRLPVEEANKDQKEELMEKAKKVNKPVTYIPKDLNFPFIEDEIAGNKLFYTDTDFLLDDLYQ